MQRNDLNSKVDLVTYTQKVNELNLNIQSKADKSIATTSSSGLMSSTDKTKLDSIQSNANNYSHPTTSGNKHIPSGGSSGQYLKWAADGTAVWANAPSNEGEVVEYDIATSTSNGLMSSFDKVKLDGIENNANNYSHPTSSGNKHIPSGGLKDQMLVWSADGVAKWENIPLVCEDFPTGEDFNLDESDFMLNSVLTEDFDNSDLVLENSILKSIIDDLSNRISLLEDTIKKGE